MRESITRRNLPHWYMPEAAHFVTFRIADTIPKSVLKRWRDTRADEIRNGSHTAVNAHKRFFATFDAYLDRATEKLWLANDQVADMMRTALYFHHGSKYHLLSYSILPNHVHMLIVPSGPDLGEKSNCSDEALPIESLPDERPDKTSPLSSIMHSIKSYTALQANRILGRSGQFWQHESYDHWVRDDEELKSIATYIDNNPIAAGIAKHAHEYPWCSANDNFNQHNIAHGLMMDP